MSWKWPAWWFARPMWGRASPTLSSDEIRDRLQVRLALEVIAAVGASQRAQAADFERLEQLLTNLSGAIKRKRLLRSVAGRSGISSVHLEHVGK